MTKNLGVLRRVAELVPLSQGGHDHPSLQDIKSHESGRSVLEQNESPGTSTASGNASPRNGRDTSVPNKNLHRSRPNASVREEIVEFVHRVFILPNSGAPRTVIFSPVDENGGSGGICLEAGEVLTTQMSASVCLVDANLRAPSLHKLVGMDSFPGLTDAASDSEPIKKFARRIADEKLWLLAVGSSVTAARSRLAAQRLGLWLPELKEQFDYVLVEAPPVTWRSETVLLGQIADGLVLTIEADSTRREAALAAKEALESSKVKLLGAILNNRTFPIPEALYRRL
jgi:Mrp family chromosome partitioning ATPase